MGIVFEPERKPEPVRPTYDAGLLQPGTRWLSPDGSLWEVGWDYQDRKYRWFLMEGQHIAPARILSPVGDRDPLDERNALEEAIYALSEAELGHEIGYATGVMYDALNAYRDAVWDAALDEFRTWK